MSDTDTEHRTVTFPPSKDSWISPERIDYMNKLLQTMFFVLALPYLFLRLVTKPGATFAGATSVHAAA